MSERIVCIDGDWLIYSIAAVFESSYITATHINSIEPSTIEYVNRTKFKASLEPGDDVSNYVIQDYKRLKGPDDLCLKKAQGAVKGRLNKIIKNTQSTSYYIALGGSDNFRDSLPLPYKYKGERAFKLKPLLLKSLKKWLIQELPCIIAVGEEADDIVTKFQYRGDKTPGITYLGCTVDKDSRGTEGLLYDPLEEVTKKIEGLGFIELIKKTSISGKVTYKCYGEGRKWLYYQILLGDDVDEYHPTAIASKANILEGRTNITKISSISPLKFFNIFKDISTDKECWEAIARFYSSWYEGLEWWMSWDGSRVEGTWVDVLQMYVDVAFMRRWDNDRIDVRKVLLKYDIAQ